jgi:hypothetical protein
MDAISELTAATLEALVRDYYLWIAILTIVLVFALYVYFFPQSIDFFENPDPESASMKASRERLRSEPPEDQPQ